MKLTLSFAVAAAFAAAYFAPALMAAEPAGQQGAASFKVGVVNIKVIIEKYKRTMTLEEEIEKYRQEESDKIEAKRKQVAELKNDLKMLNQEAGVFQVTWKKMRRLEMEINFDEEALKSDLQLRLLRATKEVYVDIIREIEEFAKKNGFQVVLKVETGEIESESKADLILRINSRGVLFFDESLDISEHIVKALNEKYTGKAPEKPADKPAGEGDKPAGGDKPAEK